MAQTSSRGGFNSRIGFVMAAAGSAVGLGNIWKFPFEVGAGGGAAFVVLYLAFCFILCFPIMVSEIAIGRKTGLNAGSAFQALGYKHFSIIGKMGIFCGVLILSFYNVVAAWALGYFFEIILGNFDIGNQFDAFTKDIIKVGSYTTIFALLTAFIVSKGVSDGIEKASKILMPLLVLLIVALIAYGMTLPNAIEGIKFYLLPDFSKVTFPVIYKALGQAFFSLSLGMGALITYGSYLGKSENILSSAVMITLSDLGIAVLAGFMLFPFVFYQGVDTSGGAGLIFITLPGILQSLGSTLGVVVGGSFFLLLSFAALTSAVSLLEVPVAYLVDEKKIKRQKAVWLSAGGIFLIGIPSLLANGASDFFSSFITYLGSNKAIDFMTFVADIANDTLLPLGGCLISIFVAYVWKKEKLFDEIANGYQHIHTSWIRYYLHFTLSYICPSILGILFILTMLGRFFGV